MLNLERLWTPWRMQYVGGVPHPEAACVFCALPADTDDVGNLVVHRGDHAYIMMNLFPYNTGHLLNSFPTDMCQPPVEATGTNWRNHDPDAAIAAGVVTGALGNQGANIGINVGEIAGAGVPRIFINISCRAGEAMRASCRSSPAPRSSPNSSP
ncbi:MAG: hypothetical protein R2839_09910 [Thermomicrobiales bacterium]